MNILVDIARDEGRGYVTPEDVLEAFRRHPQDPHLVRIDLLEVLGLHAGDGAEDSRLCALIGWRGGP